MANGKKSKPIRAFVASIPVLGPATYRTYRYFVPRPVEEGGNPQRKKKKKSFYTVAQADMSRLGGVSLLGGAATASNADIALRLQNALERAGETVPVIVFDAARGNEVHVGIREGDVNRFVRQMEDALDARLERDTAEMQDSERSDTSGAMLKWLRRQKRLHMTIHWPAEMSTSLVMSLYFEAENQIDSRDNRNQFLRHIHESVAPVLEKPGLHAIEDILGGRPVDAATTPVDLIYTWVNNDDPEWQEMYRSAKGVLSGYGEDARSPSRFVNRDELLYSIRSVERYLPWINRIHIFTNCAPPDWFEPSDRIRWVYHADVMPDRCLPTFNSHAIESYLHRLPDLEENFLYMNDDFFINEPLPRAYFYSTNDICNANLEDYGVVNGTVNPADKDYLNAARNGSALIRETFGVLPTRLHKHTPYPLKKSILEKLEKAFMASFERTRLAQFRSTTDISVASFLFHHYAYAIGAGTQNGYRSRIVKNTSHSLWQDLKGLEEGSGIRAFCLNDGENSHDDEQWNREIRAFLERRFAVPTLHEILPPEPVGDPVDAEPGDTGSSGAGSMHGRPADAGPEAGNGTAPLDDRR